MEGSFGNWSKGLVKVDAFGFRKFFSNQSCVVSIIFIVCFPFDLKHPFIIYGQYFLSITL
jgi:hypothetical protein